MSLLGLGGNLLTSRSLAATQYITTDGSFEVGPALQAQLGLPLKEIQVSRYIEALSKPEDVLTKILTDQKALSDDVSVSVGKNYDRFTKMGIDDLTSKQMALQIGESMYKVQNAVVDNILNNADVLKVGLRKNIQGIDQAGLDKIIKEALQ